MKTTLVEKSHGRAMGRGGTSERGGRERKKEEASQPSLPAEPSLPALPARRMSRLSYSSPGCCERTVLQENPRRSSRRTALLSPRQSAKARELTPLLLLILRIQTIYYTAVDNGHKRVAPISCPTYVHAFGPILLFLKKLRYLKHI